MMPIERMRPEDFDAVFRLLARSFPAGERRGSGGGGARPWWGAPLASYYSARCHALPGLA